MTNREVLINSLRDKEADICTVDYIACVDSPDCKYDGGSDHSVCDECKMKWLDEEWGDYPTHDKGCKDCFKEWLEKEREE